MTDKKLKEIVEEELLESSEPKESTEPTDRKDSQNRFVAPIGDAPK